MTSKLISDFSNAKNRILDPYHTGTKGKLTLDDRIALVHAKADFGCLIKSAIDTLGTSKKITPILNMHFNQTIQRNYVTPQAQEYHRRFIHEITPLLQQTKGYFPSDFSPSSGTDHHQQDMTAQP